MGAEKAFDSVRWDFLYMVLERFGFHERFVKTIQSLYNNCSISPLLFALYLEPLSQWIKQNENIKSINIKGDEQKIALYADDVLIYLTHPTRSLPALMSTLEEFGLFSGYKLNVRKTQILIFNYIPDRKIKESFRFNWENL